MVDRTTASEAANTPRHGPAAQSPAVSSPFVWNPLHSWGTPDPQEAPPPAPTRVVTVPVKALAVSASKPRSLVAKRAPPFYVHKMDILVYGRHRACDYCRSRKRKCDVALSGCEKNVGGKAQAVQQPTPSVSTLIHPPPLSPPQSAIPESPPATAAVLKPDALLSTLDESAPNVRRPSAVSSPSPTDDSDVTLRQLDAAVPPLVLDRQSPAVRDRQPYTPESGGWADSTMDSHHPADDQTYYRTEQSVGFVRPSFDPIVMMLTEINSEHTAYIPFPDALSWPDSLSITPETLQGYAPNIRVPSSPNQHLLPPPPRITDVDVDIVDRYLNHTKNGSTCRAWEIVPVFSYFRIANPGLRYTMCAAAAFALNPQPPEPIARRYFLKARHFLVSSLGENTSLDGREGILQLQVLIMITSLAKSMADISTGTSVHRLQSLFRRSLKLDEEEKADIIHDPWLMVARRRAWRVCLLVDYTLVVLTNGRFDELAGGFVRIAMPREVEFDEDRRIYWLTGLLYIQAKVWDVVRVSRLSWDIIGADDVEVSLDEWREKNVLLGVCEVELEGCRRCIMKGGWKGTFDGDEILRSVEKRIAMGLKTTLRWDLILPFAAYHASVCLIWLARAKLESRPRRWECAMKGEASAMAIVDVLTLILRCVDENGAPIPSGAKDGNAWDEEAGSTGSVGTQDGPRKGTVVWDSIYQLPAFACLASANLLFEIIKAKREIVGDMEGGHERLEELEGVRLRCQMGIRANVLSLRRFKRTVRIIEKWEMQAAAMMERC